MTASGRFIAVAMLGLIAGWAPLAPAAAQGFSGETSRGPRFEPRGPRITGGVPGRFDYYDLVLSWSPTYCGDNPRSRSEPQCNRSGRPYAFVMHGLWPQYERGFPDSCPTSDRPYVDNRTIDGIIDIMPSKPLIIHEYRKHGVCSGLQPEAYFDLARKMFSKVKIPTQFQSPAQYQMVDTNAVIGAFVAANPGLKPDMLAVVCGGAGNRLKEVRVCMSREGQFRPCGYNENQRKLCNSPRVYVPPVRGAGLDDRRGGPAPRAPMLPGPVAPGARSL